MTPKRPQARPSAPKRASAPPMRRTGPPEPPDPEAPGTLVLDFRRPPRPAPSDRVQVSPHGELVLGTVIPKRKDTR